jgi:putative membrane protein
MTRTPLSALLTGAAIAGLAALPLLAQGQQQGGQQGQQQQQQQQQGRQQQERQSQKPDPHVEQFITKAAHSGHSEVALAQLALRKSTSEQVKALATKLQTDHQAVNQKLMTLARERNITIRGAAEAGRGEAMARTGVGQAQQSQQQGQPRTTPQPDPNLAQLEPEHRAIYERLDKLSGAQFDRAWADQIIKSHQAGIELFTKATKFADEGVKTFAEQTLPALREHLKRAQEIQP